MIPLIRRRAAASAPPRPFSTRQPPALAGSRLARPLCFPPRRNAVRVAMPSSNEGGLHNPISKLRSKFANLSTGSSPSKSSDTSAGKGTDVPGRQTAPEAATVAATSSSSSELDHSKSFSGVKPSLRQLYPAIEPFETNHLRVSDVHQIYYEQSGKRDGHPVVFLHGGPGGGVTKDDRRWFDPNHYRIVTFDQRGAGKSTPSADLSDNTTWDLVEDIERLRKHLGIDKWHVFGGSWGSTLSLAYAQAHPANVTALILRGIFTLRRSELLFFYQDGASHLFPDQWGAYWNHIPEAERHDMISAYYKRLTGADEAERLEAAKRWSTWENATSKLYMDPAHIARGDDPKWALAFARIESHFFVNAGWMRDGQLLERANVDKIRHIPAVIVQGRYDVVCPATTAWALHEQWPEAEFFLVPDAGHSAKESGILDKLIYATDKLREAK